MPEIKAVLFDLDGTLADTAPDLGGALNELLRARGLPEQPLDAIRPHTGHGSASMLAFAAGITPQHADFADWQQDYLARYLRRDNRDTVLFDGINPLLDELARRRIAWGIITNKPQRFTDPLLPKLRFSQPPAVAVCGDTCAEAKPSVMPMLHACRQIGIAPEHCLYVGDAQRDIQAGNDAGMTSVLAAWGYIGADDAPETWQYAAKAENPMQILDILTAVQAA